MNLGSGRKEALWRSSLLVVSVDLLDGSHAVEAVWTYRPRVCILVFVSSVLAHFHIAACLYGCPCRTVLKLQAELVVVLLLNLDKPLLNLSKCLY